MTRTTIITGATSGIGLHLTKALAKRGYAIIAVGRTLDRLQAMIAEEGFNADQVEARQLDVRDYEQWQGVMTHAIEKWGQLDILINNAGIADPAFIQNAEPETITRILDTNIKGAIYGANLAAQHMIAQERGHIVNIGSLGGIFPLPGSSVYTASKFALRGFSYAIAVELREYGVHVSCIMPDSVDTPQHRAEIHQPEAAMSFQSPHTLSVQDIEQAVLTALNKHKVELSVPRIQGWLAKLGMSLTGITWYIFPSLLSDARKNQAKRRAKLQQEQAQEEA